MPGVQCVICLASDTNSEDWSVLTGCGHVFHTHCVLQSLEHSKRCPQCRVSVCVCGKAAGWGTARAQPLVGLTAPALCNSNRASWRPVSCRTLLP